MESIDEEILERDELIFRLISDTYDSEKDRANNIDEKASKLIVFVGVLIGLLATFGSSFIHEIPKTNILYVWFHMDFIFCFIILTCSVICGLYAYWFRKFVAVPNPNTMIQYAMEDKKKIDIIRIISMERTKAIEINEITFRNKIIAIKLGFFLLVIGIIGILSLICIIFSYTPQ